MASSAKQIRDYRGPALLSYGFRPFFLFGAVWAAISLAVYIPLLNGTLRLPTLLAAPRWHAHELIYGYAPAVIAGFLLTAVPNWTGRLPVVGVPLMTLFSCWLIGRVAMAASALTGSAAAGLLDLSFLSMLVLVVGREIVAANNVRNLKVLVLLLALLGGNTIFHIESAGAASGGYGERIGIAVIVMMIMVIGGRIIPSFTRNWLVKQATGRLPAPFDDGDRIVMIVSGIALASWVSWPESTAVAWLAVLAMVANLYRLTRWAGDRTLAEPLVLVLHIAFAFVPIGFGSIALATLAPSVIAPSGAVHVWTAGAISLMTLAVMTRAALGHTGRPLRATWPITSIYLAAILAGVSRTLAALDILPQAMLHASAGFWIAAYLGFAVVYAPLLARRRA